MGFLVSALVFVLVLGFMVFIHELGHFVMAKRAGIRVEEFGIGFPPKIVGFRRGETEYTLNLLPLGGFVRMTGEDDPSDPRSFAAAPKRWRIGVLVAGSFMNLLAAGVIFSLGYATGWPTPTDVRVVVREVSADSPAQSAGLRPGDIITAANGAPVTSIEDFRRVTTANLGQPVTVGYERNGQAGTTTLTPRQNPPAGQGAVGVQLSESATRVESKSYPLGESIQRGFSQLLAMIILTFEVPVRALQGAIPADLARPVGPVGIFQITESATQRTTETGNLYYLLFVAGTLGAGLGIANLLPIPGLDGGRLLFILIEAIRGRRVDPRREGYFHLAGFVFLIGLVLLISYFDIMHPISGGDLGGP